MQETRFADIQISSKLMTKSETSVFLSAFSWSMYEHNCCGDIFKNTT